MHEIDFNSTSLVNGTGSQIALNFGCVAEAALGVCASMV
jgi:hypothetical protein